MIDLNTKNDLYEDNKSNNISICLLHRTTKYISLKLDKIKGVKNEK